jgi:site-specific DNA recombinase
MTPYVIYSRKSLEDEDSQVQSIQSQEKEMKSVAMKMGFTVIEPLLSEAKSAKAPGRPVFDEMMKRVDRGEIRGILCWKLDRLARNPVDGGRIIWAIKQHGLVIRTPHQTFSQAEDNIILTVKQSSGAWPVPAPTIPIGLFVPNPLQEVQLSPTCGRV